MKKVIGVLTIISLGIMGKLGYDLYNVSLQQQLWAEKNYQLEQNYAVMKDQIAALQRQLQQSPNNSPEDQPKLQTPPQLDVMQYLRARLDLIEFALSQYQPLVALEKIQALRQQSFEGQVSEALQASLGQVLAQDEQLVVQYMQSQARQNGLIAQSLNKIDQALKKQLASPKLDLVKEQNSGWSAWFKLEKVQQPAALAERSLILKEVQMRVILAQQELLKGRTLAYQTNLSEIIQLLEVLPDAESQQIKAQIQQLKQQPNLAIPKLNTRALVD